jgi:hypothetical protein
MTQAIEFSSYLSVSLLQPFRFFQLGAERFAVVTHHARIEATSPEPKAISHSGEA